MLASLNANQAYAFKQRSFQQLKGEIVTVTENHLWTSIKSKYFDKERCIFSTVLYVVISSNFPGVFHLKMPNSVFFSTTV